jgi:hypothetical protein
MHYPQQKLQREPELLFGFDRCCEYQSENRTEKLQMTDCLLLGVGVR